MKQDALKRAMRDDLGGHLWQYPIDIFTQIISPRKLKHGVKSFYREDFKFSVDALKPFFTNTCPVIAEKLADLTQFDWPADGSEEQNYNEPFAKLLSCVTDECQAALDQLEVQHGYTGIIVSRHNRFYNKLSFVSGLSATEAIGIKSDGLSQLIRVMMTIMLWKAPHHAGLNPFTNDHEIWLPKMADGTEGVKYTIHSHLHESTSVRGRGSTVNTIHNPSSTTPQPIQTYDLRSRTPTTRDHMADADVTEDDEDDACETKHSSWSSSAPEQAKVIGHYSMHNIELCTISTPNPALMVGTLDLTTLDSKFICKGQWVEDNRKNVERGFYAALQEFGRLFGTAEAVASWASSYPQDNGLISTHIYLPKENEAERYRWKLFVNQPEPAPQPRVLINLLLRTIGRSLLTAPSTSVLFEAVIHAHLGWLNAYQAGFLHRDISVGNVLYLDNTNSEKSKTFALTPGFLDASKSVEDEVAGLLLKLDATKIAQELTGLSLVGTEVQAAEEVLDEARVQAGQILKEAQDLMATLSSLLGNADEMSFLGFICDGDLAEDWRELFNDFFATTPLCDRSGTFEFMSDSLLRSRVDYLQAPMDDLESFFHMTVWAVLWNHYAVDSSSELEEEWRAAITGQHIARRGATIALIETDFTSISVRAEGFSSIVIQAIPVLADWKTSLRELRKDWNVITFKCRREHLRDLYPDASEEDINKLAPLLLRSHWHACALKGVHQVIKIYLEHKTELHRHGNFPEVKK
ncbi:hypothetical protein BD410DRAFT_787339 [Rickenella mellea]|uniref:Fungal-type protein kinase domain-containing protein n=1 Tax=Rickenella mellea TaxID=50990 RepID=A0A4Y7Q8G6_9AGAM|nr:hypothetical protein BD410DRAFT_787339 [Rickenella mellea]